MILSAVLFPACTVQHRIVVTGSEIHRNIVPLRTRGQAVVNATDERDGQDGDIVAEPITTGTPVTIAGKSHRVGDLMAGCRDVLPFPDDTLSDRDCGLVRYRYEPLELERFETRSARPVIGYTIGGLVLGGTVGSVACVLGCNDDSTPKEVSEVVLAGMGVTLVGAIVWAILSCSGKWGQPGCRD